MKRRLMLIVATCAICVLGYGLRGSAQQESTSASVAQNPASPAANHQAVLSKYCISCHNEKLKSGNLALTALDISADASTIVGIWQDANFNQGGWMVRFKP